MRKFRIVASSLFALLLMLFLGGCGQETAYVADSTRPVVTSTSPAAGATSVSLNPPITATFSKPMNAATITGSTFTVTGPGGASVAGTVAYTATGSIATFTPAGALAFNTTYVATITTGAQDRALPANSLLANYVWSFTTALSPTPPTVISTNPANGATNVAITQAISATFSTAMTSASINATTYTVSGPGGILVPGTVTYSAVGNIATFRPATALAVNTTYVGTITTGARDANGVALAANYPFTFTTVPAATPLTVLSTIPLSNAAGVPVNQVVSATFSRAVNPATVNTSTFVITGPGGSAVGGTVTYAGTTASFTPTSPLATNTTYLATITTGVQDTNGTALATNYAWTFTTVSSAPPAILPTVLSTIPVSGATGVPVNQVISAVFSKAMNPATINATTFTVAGPGSANIAGTVSYSSGTNTATFTPSSNLATGSTYILTITTGAQDTTGNGLAANYVSAFRTVAAPAPPTVIATNPPNNATGVPFNQKIAATFSSAMNPATINATTFQLTAPGGVSVPGTVSYIAAGSVATFSPTAALLPNVTYVATVTTGAQDTMGTALANNYVWVFTTGAAPDTTSPTVISTLPPNAATGVPFNQAISATFSEPMNASTITSSSFTLTGPGGAPVAGLVSYAAIGNTATFTPTANLAASTLFTATITTGVTDLAGNAPAANYVWTFTTGAAPDTTPPTVTSTIPANGGTAAALNQAVIANFSEAMDPLSITNATFQLTGPGGTVIAATITYNPVNFIATLQPVLPLTAGASYIATVTSGATDLAGNPLAAGSVPNPWTFTAVATSPVLVLPTVVSTNPVNGATGVPVTQVISAVFSKAMNPATINGATFTVQGPGAANISGVITYAAATNTATFTPSDLLAAGATYIVTITAGAQDTAGNGLAANYVWAFRTVVGPAPPTVLSTIPVNGATGVPITQAISAVFSKAMNPATINATTFTVGGPGSASIAGVISYSAATNTATFTPADNLATGSTYVVTITTGAQDTTGNALVANYVWAFRTVAAPAPPTVITTNPLNNATGVPFNQQIAATFSSSMNPATINATTFLLTAPGGVPVAGTVNYVAAGSVATFSPTVDLLPNLTYVATITTGARDTVGTPLANNYVWTFTTGAAPDTTRPTVISTIPINGATNVPFNQAISATFSEAMNAATITASSFTVTGAGGAPVAGLVTYAAIGNTATFTPTANLAPSTLFTATVTNTVTDLAGNSMLANRMWTFTTGAVPDTTPPTILSTVPLNRATGVPLNQAVSATFSEAMNPLSITTATFRLFGPDATPIPATITYNPVSFIATLQPTLPLLGDTTYVATVTTGAVDIAGNALAAGGVPNPWIFTTGAVVIPSPINLGTAALFGGFGGSAGMTNDGTSTIINGNIGTTGVSTLITGFHDLTPGCTYTQTPLNMGTVNGAIDTAPPPPTGACPNEGTALTSSIAAQASVDAGAAYLQLAGIPGGMDVSVCPGCGGGSAGELGNRTLASGIYKSAPGTYGITQGDLILDAKGDPNAFWVFQAATTLTVGTPSFHRSVLLVNGAQAKNVFWQVGTAATINGVLGGGTMSGTIIAQTGVTVSTTGVAAVTTINGRALSLLGPVILDNTVINVPAP